MDDQPPTGPGPGGAGRDIPPEAVRNLKRRYGRVRWLAYAIVAVVALGGILGQRDYGPAAIALGVAAAIVLATWLLARRALHLARFGVAVPATILKVRRYRVLDLIVALYGLVDVVFEYRFGEAVIRKRKSIHSAWNPQPGGHLDVIVDPQRPRRCMLWLDLGPRLLKS
jgi:hypothetical protein